MSYPRPDPATRYALKGFLFNAEPNRRVRRLLENPVPFSLFEDLPKAVIVNNALACYQLIKFYDHFNDADDYYASIAADIGWPLDMLTEVMEMFSNGRERFLNGKSSRYVPMGASEKDAHLCSLVDDCRLDTKHNWTMTMNRMLFISVTRKRWALLMQTDPRSIVNEELTLPVIDDGDIDWKHPPRGRDRSRSPRLEFGLEPTRYRERSPLDIKHLDYQDNGHPNRIRGTTVETQKRDVCDRQLTCVQITKREAFTTAAQPLSTTTVLTILSTLRALMRTKPTQTRTQAMALRAVRVISHA